MVWIEGCQIEVKRYALLDTDFISKTHSVQDDGGNHLIDRVMELPEYEFFCHAQIVTELNRYNADTPIWLSEKIGAQKIKSYTDQEILESLSLVRGPLACATYTQMLKLACDAFSKDYFSEHYQALEEADYAAISREDYLKELERLDIEVGKKNNLGEIKSFVLLQVLSVMLGEQIYVFCSDDKNARNGATNFEDVRCISLVSVFSRLKEESNWTLADAEPYIESLIAFYQDHHQTTFRVMEASEVRRLQQIPCRQVLQEIFEGKSAIYNTMLTGYMPDYTCLVTPIFRAYEYYLHRILGDIMGLDTETDKGANNFSFFTKNAAGLYECNSRSRSALSAQQLNYLNNLYTKYNSVRHPYSHWSASDVDTAVITSIDEARNLLNDGIILVNQYYTLF